MNIALRVGLAVCAATTLAGCAKTGDTASDTAAADTAAGAIETTGSPPSGAPAGAASGAATGEADPVHVPLREWTIRVSKSPIRAGRTTFHAMNEGRYQHAVEIEGNGQEWKIDPVSPGGTGTVAATLTPGTYKVYCPIVDTHGNHQGRGMSTTLVVQ